MSSPFVSVIVPVYNTQKYILQCMKSLHKQTYRDFEVILVDDGSSDDSPRIISRFIEENGLTNFRLVSKENGGLCSARNFGMQFAKGQWIAHVDSDDWVEPDYLSGMADAIKETDADFCLTGFRAYDERSQKFDIWSGYPLSSGTLPEDMYALTSFDYSWARMYKKSIIDSHSLSFDERIAHCEDNAFNFDYIRFVKKFTCVQDVCYNYRRGVAGALSGISHPPHRRVHVFEHMERFVDSFSMDDIITTLNRNRSFSGIMWNVFLTRISHDILENRPQEARRYVKTDLAKAIVSAYQPRSKKDHALRFLVQHAFSLFVTAVRACYSNPGNPKTFRRLYHFLSH